LAIMARRLQMRRLVMLAVMLVVVFAALGYRLVDLQVLRHEDLIVRAQQNTHREFLLEPRRGDILDIKGNILASSMPARTVCADVPLLGNRQAEVAHVLAPLLKTTESELLQKFKSRLKQNEKDSYTNVSHYLVLKRKVPVETWQAIQTAMQNLSFG